jgi:hypothetical protein
VTKKSQQKSDNTRQKSDKINLLCFIFIFESNNNLNSPTQ